MHLDDAEDLWLACLMLAPAYADHSLVTRDHLTPRAQAILEEVRRIASEGWPVINPDQVQGCNLRTIERRMDLVDAETTIPAAEKSLLNAWSNAAYAKALRDASTACEEKGREEADRILEEARRIIGASNSGIHWETPGEVATACIDEAERALDTPDMQSLGSGMEAVDKAVKNWPPKRMTTIGGWTNEGKSTFGVQLITGLAMRGTPVCMISLEDESRIPVKRQMSMLASEVDAVQRLGADKLERPDIDLFRKTIQEHLDDMPMHMVYAVGWSVNRVCYAIQDAVRRFKCRVVMVDYLQCFEGEPGENRSVALGRATRKLKAATAEVGAHLILVSQLRRPEDPRTTPPSMYMFKSSGDIENATEYAMCVWRPSKGDKVSIERAKVLVGKSKDGDAGTIDIGWDTQRHIFTLESPDDASHGQREVGDGGWSRNF